WILLAVSAFVAGCALSVKWTGASALGLILAAWLIQSLRERVRVRRVASEAALLLLVPFATYVAAFALHFGLLRASGPGDGFMSREFQATLIGNPAYDPDAHMSLAAKLLDVHRAIGRGNRSLETASHIGASPWYTWPIMKHP